MELKMAGLNIHGAKAATVSRTDPNAVALLSVGNKFDHLKIELLMLDRIYNHIRAGGHWSEQMQDHWDNQREHLMDQMQDIASKAISLPALCHNQLRVKARILLDYCMPEGGDTPELLGISICNDILAARFDPPADPAEQRDPHDL
jgi:hypothetical protein